MRSPLRHGNPTRRAALIASRNAISVGGYRASVHTMRLVLPLVCVRHTKALYTDKHLYKHGLTHIATQMARSLRIFQQLTRLLNNAITIIAPRYDPIATSRNSYSSLKITQSLSTRIRFRLLLSIRLLVNFIWEFGMNYFDYNYDIFN